MKKLSILFCLLPPLICVSQQNTEWYYPSVSNSTQSGYIGIGTKSTTSNVNNPLPNFNLHVHGTVDYITPINNEITYGNSSNEKSLNYNYGITTRIGLTNTITGMSNLDGGVLQMSQMNFFIRNQSDGDLFLGVPRLSLKMSNSTKRMWLGNTFESLDGHFATLNIRSNTGDNGLYIQTNNSLRYALRVKVSNNESSAIEVFGTNQNLKNFYVNGAGNVYARKYTTTLSPIPDYVFSFGYNLMPLNELRSYISDHHHLPNIPSATELSSQPVDLGDMNLMLLEKVEELTLYILELEEKISVVEEQLKSK